MSKYKLALQNMETVETVLSEINSQRDAMQAYNLELNSLMARVISREITPEHAELLDNELTEKIQLCSMNIDELQGYYNSLASEVNIRSLDTSKKTKKGNEVQGNAVFTNGLFDVTSNKTPLIAAHIKGSLADYNNVVLYYLDYWREHYNVSLSPSSMIAYGNPTKRETTVELWVKGRHARMKGKWY